MCVYEREGGRKGDRKRERESMYVCRHKIAYAWVSMGLCRLYSVYFLNFYLAKKVCTGFVYIYINLCI